MEGDGRDPLGVDRQVHLDAVGAGDHELRRPGARAELGRRDGRRERADAVGCGAAAHDSEHDREHGDDDHGDRGGDEGTGIATQRATPPGGAPPGELLPGEGGHSL